MSRRGVLSAAAGCLALALAGCGGSSSSSSTSATPVKTSPAKRASTPAPAPKPSFRSYPQLLPSALRTGPTDFVPASRWQGRLAAWVAHTPGGVSLLSFNQHLVRLTLHSGTIDAGTLGWRYGPTITSPERRRLVAAFNGGFRLSTGAGGFMSYGHVAVPLRDGLGSIVTYADGFTDIGAWHQGPDAVPAPGHGPVDSVRQNLNLLIAGGAPGADVGCDSCWGATLGGVSAPARSALGITADGHLIWAGGERLTVSALAGALLAAHVARAVELDINPEWVAAYLYNHHGGTGPVTAVQVMPDQSGIPGQLLAPYSRDFFTIVSR